MFIEFSLLYYVELAVADPKSSVGGFLSGLRAKCAEKFLPTMPTFPNQHFNLYASMQREEYAATR